MTGDEMKSIRHRLGLSAVELGRAMGYTGADNTISVTVRRYESEMRPIPPWLGRLLEMFRRHGVPPRWTYAPELVAAFEAVDRSASVEELSAALNALKRLYPDGIDEIEIPQFEDAPDVDWNDWVDEPLAADLQHVLFRGQDGRIFYMDRADVENGDDE